LEIAPVKAGAATEPTRKPGEQRNDLDTAASHLAHPYGYQAFAESRVGVVTRTDKELPSLSVR